MSQTIRVSTVSYGRTFVSEVRLEDGVYVWASNGQVPPADAITRYGIDRLPGYDADLHDRARLAQQERFLAEYRAAMRDYQPTAEELFEMRAAFGPGAVVVDVITGKKTTT